MTYSKLQKVFLHIGMEKTGSTSIQKFIYHSRDILEKHNLFVLDNIGAPNNSKLVYAFLNLEAFDQDVFGIYFADKSEFQIWRADVIKKFEQEIAKIQRQSAFSGKVVISSEYFHSRMTNQDNIHEILEFLSRYFYEIEVICFVRLRSSMETSLIDTLLKEGHHFSNKLAYKSYMDNLEAYFNGEDTVSRWTHESPQFKVRKLNYNNSNDASIDVVQEFSNIIGIPKNSNTKLSRRYNVRLHPFIRSLLIKNNTIFPRYIDGNIVNKQNAIGNFVRGLIKMFY
jgi:hypothetical protein